MSYKHFSSRIGKDFYTKVDATTGVTIISPKNGSVTITKDSFVDILNFMNSVEYTIAKQSVVSHGRNVIQYQNENAEGELVITSFSVSGAQYPSITFATVDTKTAAVKNQLEVPMEIIRSVIYDAAKVGIVATLKPIKGVYYVDELPQETCANPDVVYYFEGKYKKLNEAQDAFEDLVGTFEERPNYPATKVEAKTGVIYQLTNKDHEYAIGLYIYENKAYKLLDGRVVTTDKLPAFAKAQPNTIYVLTKDMTGSDDDTKKKGTAWVINEGKTAYTQETRPIVKVASLPVIITAVDNVYYIINGIVSQYSASTSTFNRIGKLEIVKDALPDISNTIVDPDYVYILRKADGDKPIGSKWKFNTETKEFVAYKETEDAVESSSTTSEQQTKNG